MAPSAALPKFGGKVADPAQAPTIAELVRLDPIAYGQARKTAADALGCRASDLDAAVKAARKETAVDTLPGKPLHFDEPEPWPHPISGPDFLDVIEATIKRFCVLDPSSYVAVALWIIFTHAVDHAHTAPILYLTSPEPRCGKSTLLHLLGLLVARPLPAANVTSSALFRTIEAASPTLLLDEVDAGLNASEDRRGLLNSGHRPPFRPLAVPARLHPGPQARAGATLATAAAALAASQANQDPNPEDVTEFFEERAGILEHDAGMSRADAEAEALRLTVARFQLHPGEGAGLSLPPSRALAQILAGLHGPRPADVPPLRQESTP